MRLNIANTFLQFEREYERKTKLVREGKTHQTADCSEWLKSVQSVTEERALS